MTPKDFISKENVVLNHDFACWQDAILFAGNLLISSGCISQAYRDDMIKVVEEYGPYIVIMPGIALAHARPNGNVFVNQIALVSMPKGVDFGNTKNDPVHFLFAIAARTDKEHMMIFKTLAGFLSIDENLKTLQTATCFDDIDF
jgi:PTS system ascorbate-specific IIA component